MDAVERVSTANPSAANLENAGPAGGPGQGLAIGRVRRFGGGEESVEAIKERLQANQSGNTTHTTDLSQVDPGTNLPNTELYQRLTVDLAPALNTIAHQFADLNAELGNAPYAPDSTEVPADQR